MKKIVFFALLFSIILCSFIGRFYIDSMKTETAFIDLLPLQEKITIKIIDNYFGQNRDLIKESEDIIKKIVLKDTDNENWIEYKEYIEILIYPIDVINNNNEDLIICLNISKDTGIIAIYEKRQDSYIFVSQIENLAYINSIAVIRSKPNNNSFIVVEEILDERIGAYMIDHYMRIYYGNTKFNEVFRQSIEYEAYYYEKWTDPLLENPKWFKITEDNLIDYLSNDDGITINTSNLLSLYEGIDNSSTTLPDNFKLVQEKSFDIKYIWSNEYNYFIQGHGKLKTNNTTVGIIEKSEQIADHMLSLENPYYKIIHSNGKIDYIPISDLLEVVTFKEQ